MQNLRKILVGLAIAFLPLALFTFGTFNNTHRLLSSPDSLKQALDKSGIYTVVVKEGLSKVQLNADNSGGTDQIPVNDPQVQAVIEQAVSPAYLEQQSNGVIDNVFAWLQGKSSNLTFQVNLSDAKGRIADGMAQYAKERMDTLPTCGVGADLTANVDPFSATCLPPKFDKNAAVQQVHDQIANSQDFLKDPVVTANSVQDNSGQTVQQKLQRVPAAYKQVTWGMYISGILALACTVGIVLLSATLRSGIRRIGIIYIAIGALTAALAWFSSVILDQVSSTLTHSSSNTQLQVKIVEVVKYLTNDVRHWWLGYGLALLGLGVICVIATALMRSKGAPQPVAHASHSRAVASDSPLPTSIATPENQSGGGVPAIEHKKQRPLDG